MKVKRYIAANMQTALRQVSHELGDDAVIISTKKVAQGLEVVAALDYLPHHGKQDVERQLRLQDELERAKQDLLADNQQERVHTAQRADLSTTQGLSDLLSKLKQPTAEVRQPVVAVPTRLEGDYSSLLQVQQELQELKQLLLEQRSTAVAPSRKQDAKRAWVQGQILSRCADLGLDSELSQKLVAHINTQDVEQAWQQVLQWIEKNLPVTSRSWIEKGGIVALVGPAGAGKTTTIGKAAAQAVLLHGADAVALVTLDNYRVAAHDQLRTFARILGVELKIVPTAGSLKDTLATLQDKKLVLIDTAGLSPQDAHFSTQLAKLRQTGKPVKKLLVLPLTSQLRNLQESYRHFKLVGLQGCIFTKLDECFSLGGALSVAIRAQLPLTLVANGPHIPQDLHQADVKKLVKLAQRMTNSAYNEWHNEMHKQPATLQ